jgi:PTH1 family peptidyl-tRNA hydrolase
MWLIVGLGNPGNEYAKTRHNLGFIIIDALSSKFSIPLKNKTRNFVYGPGSIANREVILVKPLTFMNRSGTAVRDAIRKYKDIDNFIVIHDDLDLNTSILRIKRNGSAGGHKGIESVIEAISTKNFLRLKVGIGHPERIPAEEYVLKPFTRKERPIIKKSVENAVDAIVMILDKGISRAQNKFH